MDVALRRVSVPGGWIADERRTMAKSIALHLDAAKRMKANVEIQNHAIFDAGGG